MLEFLIQGKFAAEKTIHGKVVKYELDD